MLSGVEVEHRAQSLFLFPQRSSLLLFIPIKVHIDRILFVIFPNYFIIQDNFSSASDQDLLTTLIKFTACI